jgi:hypothetical protein
MEHVDLHKKKKNTELVLYQKIDAIPVRDYLYMKHDKEFGRQLYQKGMSPDLINLALEKIIYSNHFYLIGSSWIMFFAKKRKLIITSE